MNKSEIELACLPLLFSNLEDRNPGVGESAKEAVFGFMLHMTYESLMTETENLKVLYLIFTHRN